MSIFHWYVIREHIAPFVFAFCIIMFVLIMKLMLELMDMLISKGVGLFVLFKLLAYNLAWMVALVVPMSVLVATVMAFGRMGASQEIVAMKAAGISMYRIVSPIIFISIILTMIMIWFNNSILPEANYRAYTLRRALALKKPILSLKNREGQFISELPDITIRVDKINETTEEIFGVVIFKREESGTQTIIVAEKARFIPYIDCLSMVLTNGEIHRTNPKNPDDYLRSKFERFTYTIRGLSYGVDTSYQASRNDRTMTTVMMREEIKKYEKIIDSWQQRLARVPKDTPTKRPEIRSIGTQIQQARMRIYQFLVEIHKKNSIPFAAIVFAIMGSALGILVQRSGASIGIGTSIGFFMVYYLFLIGGESAGDRMLIQPWIAMWSPNIIFGGCAIILFIYATRR